MNYIGIDLSLTGSGVVVLDDTKKILEQQLIVTTAKQQIEERLINITDNVMDICIKYPGVINMEGLSFGSKGQSMLELGALHYLLRCNFFSKKMEFTVVPPNSLKKFICGKGQAKKNLMLAYTLKKYGILFEDDNISDAYGLSRMAEHDYNKE